MDKDVTEPLTESERELVASARKKPMTEWSKAEREAVKRALDDDDAMDNGGDLDAPLERRCNDCGPLLLLRAIAAVWCRDTDSVHVARRHPVRQFDRAMYVMTIPMANEFLRLLETEMTGKGAQKH